MASSMAFSPTEEEEEEEEEADEQQPHEEGLREEEEEEEAAAEEEEGVCEEEEEEEEEDEEGFLEENYEEAAFLAQTQAFLRTCDAHRLAVHSLVEDLIEHSENSMRKDDEEEDAGTRHVSHSLVVNDEVEDVKKQKVRVRVRVKGSEENSVIAHPDIKKTTPQLSSSASRKNSFSKPPSDQSTTVKTSSAFQKRSSRMKASSAQSITDKNLSPSYKNSFKKLSSDQSHVASKDSPSSQEKSARIKPSLDQSVKTNKLSINKKLIEGECRKEGNVIKPSLQGTVSSIPNPRRGNKLIGKAIFSDDENAVETTEEYVYGKPSLGSFFLKLTRQVLSSGNDLESALNLVCRAVKHYEKAASCGGIERNLKRNHGGMKKNHCGMNGNEDGIDRNLGGIKEGHGVHIGMEQNHGVTKANDKGMVKARLDLATSLHAEAAIRCSLGQYEEAARVLERSISVPNIESGGCQHALAVFVGYIHLGDTFILLGKREEAFEAYHAGLEIQMVTLGDQHPHVGETCRYLAEAHAQALQFDKAEILCQHALDIWRVNCASGTVGEASDRLLMGLICNESGKHEAALENFILARDSFNFSGDKIEEGSVEASIGDTYVFLGCLDKAVTAYQKALITFKSNNIKSRGTHIDIASVYVSLAGVYLRVGKVRESRGCCETALRIYARNGIKEEIVACALTEIAIIYETLNEHKEAISLLKKAIFILVTIPGRKNMVAGVEAQIGILEYLHRNYMDAHSFLSKALLKLRESGEGRNNSSLLGMVLNHMGLVYVQLSDMQQAVKMFEESKNILEATYGPHHPETLSVYSNLAGAYDALGRLDDAITILSYSLEARKGMTEEGACIELEDEKARLIELLKARKTRLEPRRAIVNGHKLLTKK